MADTGWATRRTNDGIRRNRLRMRAAHRAQQRLIKNHPEEYRVLLNEERRAVGLLPVFDAERNP